MGTVMEQTTRPRRAVSVAPGRYQEADQTRLPWDWWRVNERYTVYMLRELSSVFVALWSAIFMVQLGKLRGGREEYERFVMAQRRPGWMLFHAVSLAFSLLHAVTWLQLAGLILRVPRFGGRKIEAGTITAAAFGGWAFVSAAISLILLLGRRRK
jgi:fumarate reductase subunit C